MSEEVPVRVNFAKPIPLFPLGQVTLMPHAVLPVHIFEPRYRQMVDDALDGPGQIAMAVIDAQAYVDQDVELIEEIDSDEEFSENEPGEFDADAEDADPTGDLPPLRPAVCVGQIVQHQKLPDGRYNIAVHGICRARIIQEFERPPERLYRSALLEPVGLADLDESRLVAARERIGEMLGNGVLADMTDSKTVSKHLADPEVPTSAILELVSFSLLSGAELRYRLLAEGDATRRAAMIQAELYQLRRLLELAAPQRTHDSPKGCHWN